MANFTTRFHTMVVIVIDSVLQLDKYNSSMATKPVSIASTKSPLFLRIVVFGVAFNGLVFIGGTLIDEFVFRRRLHDTGTTIAIPLIAGLTLLYLCSLLVRRKRAAWGIAIFLYMLILGFYSIQLILAPSTRYLAVGHILRYIVLPLIIISGLIYYRHEFTVRSDIQNFRQSIRFVVLVLVITLLYGITGYMLMDNHDFHQEITFWAAVHHTIDQFGLTTSKNLVPYTRRAKLFTESLSIISIGSVTYAVVSLFQPLKARFLDHGRSRELLKKILTNNPASSEDFFKLWPPDKMYYISEDREAALALHVYHGVALVIGDPAGSPKSFDSLIYSFDQLCYHNDWTPAFIHIEEKNRSLYEKFGFSLQKIGEEAVVDISEFKSKVLNNKYFRHINNKFTKLNYSTEFLVPPHSQQLLAELRNISEDWLSRGGHTERGLMMGYFSAQYMQSCPIMVVKDVDGKIKAFINQIFSFDNQEANFDLLRHTDDSPSNINDFLLCSFFNEMDKLDYKRCNLGLSPLTGIDKVEESSIIDSAMRFTYAHGDRLYSFSGLHRFKDKYEPNWSSRYIAYQGKVRGFTKVLNALNQSMKVPKQKLKN